MEVAISDKAHKSKMTMLSNSWALRHCTRLLTGLFFSTFTAPLWTSLFRSSVVSSLLLLLSWSTDLLSFASRACNVFRKRLKLSISSVTAILQNGWDGYQNLVICIPRSQSTALQNREQQILKKENGLKQGVSVVNLVRVVLKRTVFLFVCFIYNNDLT